MNDSNGFWLNFRRIDAGDRSLLQILIDGKDAELTDELQTFLKNAAADILFLIRAYRDLRTQLAEERKEAKIILRELRDEIEWLKKCKNLKTKGAGSSPTTKGAGKN